jgi:serine/threonine protein kinase
MTTLLSPDMLKDLEQLHLSKSQLQEVQALMAQPGADPTRIVQSIGERGLLTPYQVRELLKGRGKELRIGPYVIVAFVGEGGMGIVYKAIQPALGRVVALKVVKSERLSNPRAIRRFQREVKATAQLSHPNIVSALHADQADNKFYLVMEFVYGNSLAQRVQRKGPMRLSRACEYIRQTALGMQHAHERGMIHRDIKPQNLMLTSDKTTVKILDLGLARMIGENAAALRIDSAHPGGGNHRLARFHGARTGCRRSPGGRPRRLVQHWLHFLLPAHRSRAVPSGESSGENSAPQK